MNLSSSPVFRFAPSPNGPLHLGHALSALVGWRMAQAANGRFLLRIEDIDLARSRDEHVAAIEADLAWLGLSWERPVMRQSTRFEAYARAVDQLRHWGLIYPCSATRSEIDAAIASQPDPRLDPDGVPLFPNQLRRDSVFKPGVTALRLDMARAVTLVRERLGGHPLTLREITPQGRIEIRLAHPERWGDVVLVRKEFPASYHLAVVVDDATQGVTHVTRGMDLLAATDVHRLLQVLLGLPEPNYHHHRLVSGPDGRKLSKSAGAAALASLRAEGCDINHLVATLELPMPPHATQWGQNSLFEIKTL